jgi:hypothetical protein
LLSTLGSDQIQEKWLWTQKDCTRRTNLTSIKVPTFRTNLMATF